MAEKTNFEKRCVRANCDGEPQLKKRSHRVTSGQSIDFYHVGCSKCRIRTDGWMEDANAWKAWNNESDTSNE